MWEEEKNELLKVPTNFGNLDTKGGFQAQNEVSGLIAYEHPQLQGP